MSGVVQNLQSVRERITRICAESARDPSEVQLLAVSKTKPATQVQEAIAVGQQDFGENYVQDAMDKVIRFPNVHWHFIGHIQSNKTRWIANHFDWVHSLDSLKIARRLNEQRQREAPLNVLLQINVSNDPAKAGLAVDEAGALLEGLSDMERLLPRGLMTITEETNDTVTQRKYFRRLAQLLNELNAQYKLNHFDQLSMGMTGDLESAIAEGATWVRIGTAIFGARKPAKNTQD